MRVGLREGLIFEATGDQRRQQRLAWKINKKALLIFSLQVEQKN